MPHIEAEHVKQWIADHGATIVPASQSARFVEFLERLPWLVSAPDWSAIGAVRVSVDSPDLPAAVQRSRLGGYEHAFLLYSPAEPGIVAPLEAMLDAIDELSWRAPGVRFFCGAVSEDGDWRIVPEAFGAYDGADHVMLRA